MCLVLVKDPGRLKVLEWYVKYWFRNKGWKITVGSWSWSLMCIPLFRIYFQLLTSDHNLKILLLNQYCLISTDWFYHSWRPFTIPVSLRQFSIANKRVGQGLLNLARFKKVLVLSFHWKFQNCNTSNFLLLLGENMPFLGQLPPDNLHDQMMVFSQGEEVGGGVVGAG